MTQIDPQVKAKIEEIVADMPSIFHQLNLLTDFVYTLGHNETDPTILKLMDLYHNHSDLILEYFIEKYRASK
mgnify:FL=1|jgi:hypothetical protein